MATETRASRRDPKRSATGTPKGKPKRRWLRRLLWSFLVLALLGIGAVVTAYAMIQTPKPNDLATAQTSIIYYSDGKTEMTRIAEVNRQSVDLKQVPVEVQHAVLAAEDRQFYTSGGISPTGIARAAWGIATGKSSTTGGGSTITQQYVRNYFLSQDRTFTRKAKEILISVKIDGQQTKEEILENYLNTVYFGRNANGIQIAARNYFNKDVSKLTASEGAFLAAAIQRPSYLDPWLGAKNKAAAVERWTYVMDGMVSQGWMTAAERKAATFPMPPSKWQPKPIAGPIGYVVDEVKNELRDSLKLTDDDVNRGGLRVVTTIDKNKMAAASAAIKDKLPEVKKNPLRVGMVSIVPGDGAIQMMYGGEDYQVRQQNSATQDGMQSGSTFKIFTLIAALQTGDVRIKNYFNGDSPLYFKEFAGADNPRGRVENFGNTPEGTRDLRGATALSTNTIFAALNIIATPERTVQAAKAAGVRSSLEANYANVFGTSTVTVLDMASAYATIAAEGKYAEPYLVASVTSADEAYSYKAKPKVKQVFDKDLMRDVIYCMTGPVEFGTATYAGNRLGRPAAGKTGTTSDNYSAWFNGFVPQLETAVGIYRGDGTFVEANQMRNIPGVGELTGATVPVWIWTEYMKTVLEGVERVDFPSPAYINENAKPSLGTQPPAPRKTNATSAPPTTSAPPSTSAPAVTSAPPPVTSAPPPPPTSAPPPVTSAPPPPPTSAPPPVTSAPAPTSAAPAPVTTP